MKVQILPPALALTILINKYIISAFSNTSEDNLGFQLYAFKTKVTLN